MFINKKVVISFGLALSVLFGTLVNAGGFYNFCPYCGGPVGNCYCYSSTTYNNNYYNNTYYYQQNNYDCDYYYDYDYCDYDSSCYDNSYSDCYYEEYDESGNYCYDNGGGCTYYEGSYCNGGGYNYCEEEYGGYYYGEDYSYTGSCSGGSGIQMMHWANLRDCYGNIIGTVCEGSYVEIIGIDCNDSSRTIIYDYSTGLQGSVSTVYIYGGSCYEYENPTEYGGGCGYNGYNEYSEYDCNGYYYETGYYEGSYDCSGYSDYDCSYDYSADDTYVDQENYDYSCYSGCEGIWVDVDINAQTVNIYNGDTVILSSDCVTGLPGIAETPCGQYYIMDRQRGSVLSGVSPDGVAYARAVDYWMPFTESGCGFHDATWRDSFGGDIYESYGSYGCVNCEYDFVSQMYDLVDTGCLVNIH